MGLQKRAVEALEIIADGFGGPGEIEIPLGIFTLGSTGAPLATFADGASATPGIQITDSKATTIRWNNNATLTAVMAKVGLPRDFDPTEGATLCVHVSKTGATVGDATTVTAALYNQVVGALHDADTNFGGVTGAVQGDLTAKTITRLTRALSSADLASYPSSMTVLLGPTGGTLGTDDFLLHRAYIEYTRKNAV